MKFAATLGILLILSYASSAQIVNAFSPLIQVTQKGDITHASNTILTCNGGCAAQTQTPPGSGTPFPSGATVANNAAWNNNNYTMSYVDQDGAGVVSGINSFSSSSADLTLGTTGGCGVIYAVLTWGGTITTGNANYAKRDSVYFKRPGSTNYTGLKADSKIDNTAGATTYQCYKDVTALVKAAGPGTYWAANIVATTGSTGQCGGWSLVVLYSDPTLSLRNLVIYKGYVNITNGAAPQGPQEIPLSGFFTPPSPAPVNIKLGSFSIEGDMGTLGDSLKFRGAGGSGNFEQVYDALNRQDNYFNSSITNNGAGITRSPTFPNALGYDADIVTLDNSTKKYLGNNASTATVRLTTAGDQYWVFLLTTVIDVFEPEIRLEKTYTNITNPGAPSAVPNDIIEFTLTASNKGSDPADSLIVTDSLYGGGIYVPGSLSITQGANIGAKTDGIGDDQMEFDSVKNVVKARLGIAANGTQGGKLKNTGAADSITTFKFRVKISADCEIFKCSDTLYNMGYSTYLGETSQGNRGLYSTAAGIDPATGCPLSGPVKVKIDVNPTCPPYADTTIASCSPYPLSNITPYRPGFNTFFNSSGTQVTNATTSGTYYAVRTIYPGFTWLPACKDSIQIFFTSTCVLPVIVSKFEASYNNPGIDIYWTTEQERNSKNFVLERSTDGIRFEKITEVAAAGNSSVVKNYRYTDMGFAKTAKLYYRLVLVDMDGNKQNSPVRIVLLPGYSNIDVAIETIAPNPATETTVVSVAAAANTTAAISIINMYGKQVYLVTKKLNKGSNSVLINLSHLPAGTYIVQVTALSSGARQTGKLLIK